MKSKMKIRELRKAAGMTQGELARAVGLKSGSAVTMWESGERNPSSDMIPSIAIALGCSIEELFGAEITKEKAG